MMVIIWGEVVLGVIKCDVTAAADVTCAAAAQK